MPYCKLCGNSTDLVKAHVFPRRFYEPIKRYGDPLAPPSDNVPIIISLGGGDVKPIQTQSGIWDREILCKDCDGKLIGPWDRYATSLLIRKDGWLVHTRDDANKPLVYTVENCDYSRMKLFYMSILWRSGAARHHFFSSVKLGPWEPILRKALLAQDPGQVDCFTVTPFTIEGQFNELMQNPTKQRIDGVNYIRFRYPGGGFLIKVDKRPGATALQEVALSPLRETRILTMEFMKTKEFKNVLRGLK